jgi:type I site-specific restriction endonuclease
MPHPLASKVPNPAIAPSPASEVEGGGSAASLLWAYQLRREHKALVSRIDELHNKFGSSAAATRTTSDLITGRLEKLETHIAQLRGDIKDAVSGTVDSLRTLREELGVENEAKQRRESDYASEWRAKLRELEQMVKEVTEALGREGESVAAVLRCRASTFLAEDGHVHFTCQRP